MSKKREKPVEIIIDDQVYLIPEKVGVLIMGLREEVREHVANLKKTNACQNELAKLDNFLWNHFQEEMRAYMTSDMDEEKSPVGFTKDLLLNRKKLILPTGTHIVHPKSS